MKYTVTLTESELDFLKAVVKWGGYIALKSGIDLEAMITATRALDAAKPEGDK